MRNLILIISTLLFSTLAKAQCVYVDSVYNTAKLREMGNRDIRFGIRQIVEEELSEKYCLGEGDDIDVEVFYFGIPKHSIRIVGVEKTNQITQVGVRIYFKGEKYEGIGESDVEVRAVMIELVDNKVPFDKMTVSSALKKAIHEAVTSMP
jgi:hypothetical protein